LVIAWQSSQYWVMATAMLVSKGGQTAVCGKASTDWVRRSYLDANTPLMAEWFPGANGGLADYLVVEAANARRIPDNMSLELAGKCHHQRAVITKIDSLEDSLWKQL
jgi:D-arabinose 1-dehydrogenase-like Zn-dependent alcohol dehydrogenase